MNRVAMNILEHAFRGTHEHVSVECTPGVELLGHNNVRRREERRQAFRERRILSEIS